MSTKRSSTRFSLSRFSLFRQKTMAEKDEENVVKAIRIFLTLKKITAIEDPKRLEEAIKDVKENDKDKDKELAKLLELVKKIRELEKAREKVEGDIKSMAAFKTTKEQDLAGLRAELKALDEQIEGLNDNLNHEMNQRKERIKEYFEHVMFGLGDDTPKLFFEMLERIKKLLDEKLKYQYGNALCHTLNDLFMIDEELVRRIKDEIMDDEIDPETPDEEVEQEKLAKESGGR